jgi:hypothetical protein
VNEKKKRRTEEEKKRRREEETKECIKEGARSRTGPVRFSSVDLTTK